MGRQHPPQGGTHDGRQTGQGVALERRLEIELAGDQAPTRQQGQGQGALGLQLRALQPLQFQDLILPTQAGLPGTNDGIAALGGPHGQNGVGPRPRQPQRARQGIAGQPRGQGLIPPPIPWIDLPAALPIQLGAKPTRHAQPGGTQSQLDLVHLKLAALGFAPLGLPALPVGPQGGLTLELLPLRLPLRLRFPLPGRRLNRNPLSLAKGQQVGHNQRLAFGGRAPAQRGQPHAPLAAGAPRLPTPLQAPIGPAAPLARVGLKSAANGPLNGRQRQVIEA